MRCGQSCSIKRGSSASACCTGCRRRRRVLTERIALARRRRRHPGRTGEEALYSRIAPHPGRVHGGRAASRRRMPAGWPCGILCGFGRHRLLSHRPASEHGAAHVCRRIVFAVSNPARQLDTGPDEQFAGGLQKYRNDAHHERLLPAPSGRMEHRGGSRLFGFLLHRSADRAAGCAQPRARPFISCQGE